MQQSRRLTATIEPEEDVPGTRHRQPRRMSGRIPRQPNRGPDIVFWNCGLVGGEGAASLKSVRYAGWGPYWV